MIKDYEVRKLVKSYGYKNMNAILGKLCACGVIRRKSRGVYTASGPKLEKELKRRARSPHQESARIARSCIPKKAKKQLDLGYNLVDVLRS